VICGVVALALVLLGAIVLAPRPGEPVLLVPLGAGGRSALPALLSAPDTLILARGSLTDSYVVTGARPALAEGVLRHGVLLLNANAPGCGPAS
jgi:hypothetical protein